MKVLLLGLLMFACSTVIIRLTYICLKSCVIVLS